MDQAKVDFVEGGKPENPEKNPSKHARETNYNSTHMSSKLFWESTRGYTQVVTPPAITQPRPIGLNLEFSNERRRGNHIRHPISALAFSLCMAQTQNDSYQTIYKWWKLRVMFRKFECR